MSKDDGHAFPPDWDWEQYEVAFAELTTRMAQMWEEPCPYGRLLNVGHRVVLADYETLKFENWRVEQQQTGRLPPTDLSLEADGDKARRYDDIFENYLAAARIRNRSRRVLDPDTDHGKRFNPPSGKLAPSNGNCDEGFSRNGRGRKR